MRIVSIVLAVLVMAVAGPLVYGQDNQAQPPAEQTGQQVADNSAQEALTEAFESTEETLEDSYEVTDQDANAAQENVPAEELADDQAVTPETMEATEVVPQRLPATCPTTLVERLQQRLERLERRVEQRVEHRGQRLNTFRTKVQQRIEERRYPDPVADPQPAAEAGESMAEADEALPPYCCDYYGNPQQGMQQGQGQHHNTHSRHSRPVVSRARAKCQKCAAAGQVCCCDPVHEFFTFLFGSRPATKPQCQKWKLQKTDSQKYNR